MKKFALFGAALAALVVSVGAWAQGHSATGEVRRVNADQQKVTLKHGAIDGLNVPAMTLVYVVKNPAQLADLKPGDTVRFVADRVDGHLTILEIKKQ